MIRLIICGVCGKMGQRILNLAIKDKDIEIVAGIEKKGHPETDSIIQGTDCRVENNLDKVINKCDVVIDFTSPESTLIFSESISKSKKPVVIGATGFKPDEMETLKKILVPVPAIISPNMSMGVNLLFKLVKEAAKALPKFDIEIVEAHHNQKKDAPSGTANKLAEIVCKELNRDLSKVGVYGREGIVGARTPDEIGIFSVRAGDIVGEHTVFFASTGERIELTHRAYSRDTFATGAIRAAKWIVTQKPGLYSMEDVLGL